MSYKLTIGDCILRISDGTFIPPDTRNKDYQEYLKWISEGNEPLPVDSIPTLESLALEQKIQTSGLTIFDRF